MVRIVWGLRDGRSVTVRSTVEIANTVIELAEASGALRVQPPPMAGDTRLWLPDGPVRSIRICTGQSTG